MTTQAIACLMNFARTHNKSQQKGLACFITDNQQKYKGNESHIGLDIMEKIIEDFQVKKSTEYMEKHYGTREMEAKLAVSASNLVHSTK